MAEQKKTENTGKSRSWFDFWAILIAAVLLLSSASYAWFQNNKRVDNEDIAVRIQASPNLVIAKTAAEITAMDFEDCLDDGFHLTYSVDRLEMLAATHAWEFVNEIGEDAETLTGLKYVVNTDDIDRESGLKKDGKEYDFRAVEESDESPYYLDCVAYLASFGTEMENVKLVVSISCDTSLLADNEHLNALTADFYRDSVAEANFCGKLAAVESGSGTVDIALADDLLPAHTDGSVCVIARLYFDGALCHTVVDPAETTDTTETSDPAETTDTTETSDPADTSETTEPAEPTTHERAYINIETIKTQAMGLTIAFSAEEISD